MLISFRTMDGKLTLVLLLCGLTFASANYIYGGDRFDDDYYNRGYRLASYGFAPATRFYPTYNRFNYIPRALNYGTRGFISEDLFKK